MKGGSKAKCKWQLTKEQVSLFPKFEV